MTTSPATGWEVLDTALQGLATVVGGLSERDLNLPTPCEQWNVAQLLQHATGDQAAWAAAVGGGPGPTDNPFTPSGVLGTAPTALVAEAVRRADGAWQAVRPEHSEVSTPLPVGSLPVAVAAGACALDAGVHAWDLAVATGQPSPLTGPLAATLHEAARQVVEPLRGFAYVPALPAEPGDDQVAALLKYLGRRPDWKAAS
jgi:uncharacterized protein (TIGR03086 family)